MFLHVYKLTVPQGNMATSSTKEHTCQHHGGSTEEELTNTHVHVIILQIFNLETILKQYISTSCMFHRETIRYISPGEQLTIYRQLHLIPQGNTSKKQKDTRARIYI